ncbi:MAG: CinA family protein [Lachnospiraceae bacterium]|nr:CinA family protein [Lachnospiraceae bacterium]
MFLEQDIVNRLIEMHFTVATAESCTGGMIASSIVDISGASECFHQGFVTYSEEAKINNLHVKPETIDKYGVVSAEVAREMAVNVKEITNSSFGLSTTGVAGPGGGTNKTPVGRVFIACAYLDKVRVIKCTLKGNRYQVRTQATENALKLLRDCMNIFTE